MSETLTFTFVTTGGAQTGVFVFTGGTKTCTTTKTPPSGIPVVTNGVSMSGFSFTMEASGTTTLQISNVAGTGSITSFTIPSSLRDNLTILATGNNSTWGIGNGSTPTLTSLALQFDGGATLTTVPTGIPTTVTNTSFMFNGCIEFNQSLNGWNTENITNMSNMFNSCSKFNNAGLALWNNSGSTIAVTNMSSMFFSCILFNANIGSWTTSSVTDMSSMFAFCTIFNQDIGGWNTTNVTSIVSMFDSAIAFNKNITYWTITSAVSRTNVIVSATAFQATYSSFTGYFYPDLSVAFFNQPLPERYPCFMKGTQILCLRAEEEVYRSVQDLRKGDLVKTYRNGYLPIHMIGTSSLSNPGDEERTTNRLYKCSKDLYPGLFEDLYITGCHSILVPALTNDQWENTKDMLGNVYITDNHFRLMACIDEKAQPFKKDAMIDIYHIALENEDYYMNYGIYANGLLVESCSKRYLTELSNMRIIGEDQACYDAPSVNVFGELGAFVQTF